MQLFSSYSIIRLELPEVTVTCVTEVEQFLTKTKAKVYLFIFFLQFAEMKLIHLKKCSIDYPKCSSDLKNI